MIKLIITFLAGFLFIESAYATIHYKNVSPNKTAQALFDKGMLHYYAYSYFQAEYDFRQALIYDANCGMCYWGLALTKKQEALELGQPFATVGFEDLKKARTMVSGDNEFQNDLIKAALESFSLDKKVTSKQLQLRYIHALRQLQDKYKDNAEWKEESLALFVDAIAYYSNTESAPSNHCGRPVDEDLKEEALSLLRPALNDCYFKDHPGILHTYIHFTERDLNDCFAEVAAKKLPAFSNNHIAHYAHMPTHIYWRRGLYDKAIQATTNAIAIDKNYFKENGVALNSYYYAYHYLHYYHFLAVLGVLTNNFDLAIDNARAVKNLMDISSIENLTDYRDTFLSLEHLVLARFNKWHEVLQLEIPRQTNELGLLFIRFSKALAYLNLKQNRQYNEEFEQIKESKSKGNDSQLLQKLMIIYLEAAQMQLQNKSLEELEKLFINNDVYSMEEKLFVKNPPLWFFPYQVFLAETAFARGNVTAGNSYHEEFEKMYPHASLGLHS